MVGQGADDKMNEPRINVRSKAKHRTEKSKKSETQHWAGRDRLPSPREHGHTFRDYQAADYWSPYLKPKKIKRKKHSLLASKKRASKRLNGTDHSLLKLVVSGGSAVFVGTLMGLFILKVFVGGGMPEETKTIDHHLQTPIQSAESGKSEASSTEIPLSGINAIWVQGGVYTDKEGADTLVSTRREAGQSAVIQQTDGQYRVFFGVGVTHEEAQNIAAEIEDSGEDVYLKDDLSVGDAVVPLNGVSKEQREQFKTMAEAGNSIFSKLVPLTAAGIGGAPNESDLSSEIGEIEQSHRTFVTALSDVKGVLSDSQQQAVRTMDQTLAQSVEAIKQYEREKSVTYLWQVQESLMQYLLAYEQLGHVEG